MEHTAARLRELLREAAEPGFQSTQQGFSRERLRSLGVRTPHIRALAKAAAREYRSQRLAWSQILEIAEQLWRGEFSEEHFLAIEVLSCFRSRLGAPDWKRLSRWIDLISNWAETDGLSIYLLAPILSREPERIRRLRSWTRSRNRWRRRAAAVALVPLARRGAHWKEVAAICDRLAADRDDLIEKAIGWLLKEASRTRPTQVVEYLLKNRARLSPTTLRYAGQKLPERLRARVLQCP